MAIPNNDGSTVLVTTETEFNALQNIVRKKQPQVLADLNDGGITYNELTINPYIVDEDTDLPYNTTLLFMSNSTLIDGGSGNAFTILEVTDYFAGTLSFNSIACTIFGNIEPNYIYSLRKTAAQEYTVLDLSGIVNRINTVETYNNILEAAFPTANQVSPTKLIMNGTRNILELTALIVNGQAEFNNFVAFSSPVTMSSSLALASADKLIVGDDTSGVVTVDTVANLVADAVTDKMAEIIITDVRTPEEYELETGEALASGTYYFQVSE